MAGTGTGNLLQQVGNCHEWHLRKLDRPLVQGQDDWLAALHQGAEIAAVRRVAGERHDGRDKGRQVVEVEVLL
jgi:hypothetical protein